MADAAASPSLLVYGGGWLGRAVGRDVPLQTAPRRPGDPPALVADPARAMAALGWRPRLSGLDDIVRTAVAWHRREGTG